MSSGRWVRLSKVVAHALRHEPWVYELELDEAGWVPVPALLDALRDLGGDGAGIDRRDLTTMIETASKRRYELDGDRIRAPYGHSVPGRMIRTEAAPPPVLFHGTSPRAWELIQGEGVRPMGRQLVHLSEDVATAVTVGRRKSPTPVVLRVRAVDAHTRQVPFWRANEKVWLTDQIPADYLGVEPAAGS